MLIFLKKDKKKIGLLGPFGDAIEGTLSIANVLSKKSNGV